MQRIAARKRKKVDVQKLASQVGRMLQRLKAHKYFSYRVEANGQLHWERKADLIAQEAQQDGWYLLHTNESAERCSGDQVLSHYKGLLDVEEAFCELKSYLEVRPVHHRRPDQWYARIEKSASEINLSQFWSCGEPSGTDFFHQNARIEKSTRSTRPSRLISGFWVQSAGGCVPIPYGTSCDHVDKSPAGGNSTRVFAS